MKNLIPCFCKKTLFSSIECSAPSNHTNISTVMEVLKYKISMHCFFQWNQSLKLTKLKKNRDNYSSQVTVNDIMNK